MEKSKKLLLSMIGLGAGVVYVIAGFKDRDEYLKEKYKQSSLAMETSKIPDAKK